MRKTCHTILKTRFHQHLIRTRISLSLIQTEKAEAISYRMPRPVVKVIQYDHGNVYPICPKCVSSLDREYAAFCDRCGQRLSWHALHRAEVIFPTGADHSR